MELNYGIEDGFKEFDYLSPTGRGRYYRNIMRIVYTELEKKEYLFSHEIAEKMREAYVDYNEETCNEDLEILINKGNIIKYKNDYSQIKTLEELRKKKYRYQLTDKGRLIEGFITEKLNQVNSFSTTLDPNLLLRLKEELKRIIKIEDESELHSSWNNITYAFNLLRENYKGYLSELNSFEYERMMEEETFLLKKGKLREYLEDFIKILIDEGEEIKEIIIKLEKESKLENILAIVIKKEFEKAELTSSIEYSKVKEKYKNQYHKLRSWFIRIDDHPSEVEILNRATINIIQKITKMAKQVLDKRRVSYSRKDSYLKVAELISESENMKKVNELSSIIFGDFSLYHLKGDYPEQVEVVKVENADQAVMMMKPIKERKRGKINYKIKDRTKEKQASIIEAEKRRRDEIKNLEKYVINERLIISELGTVTSEIKNTLINLIKIGLTKGYKKQKISMREDKSYYEYGEARYNAFLFKLFRPTDDENRAILRTFDGNFDTPNFRIEFIREVE